MMTDKIVAGLAIAAAVLLGGLAVVQTVRLDTAEDQLAATMLRLEREVKERAEDRAAATEAVAKTLAEYREKEALRTAALQENVNEARKERDVALQQRAAADRNAAGLRRDFRSAVAAATAAASCGAAAGGAGPAAGGEAAPSAASVLADVFDEMELAGRELADEATKRGIAGAACQRAWEALIDKPPAEPPPAS